MKPLRAALLLSGLLVTLFVVAPARAQNQSRPVLVSAFPAANQTLDRTPEEVSLTFDVLLDTGSFRLTVVDAIGRPVDRANAHLEPNNPRVLVVGLPPLEEGLYTVSYVVTALDTQISAGGSYQFALDFPEAQLRFVSPQDGAWLTPGILEFEIDSGSFDLVVWEHSWRLYIDGQERFTTQQDAFVVAGLEEGIHEVQAVVINADGEELPATTTVIHIGIDANAAADVPVAIGQELVDPGLPLTVAQQIGGGIVLIVLLGAGMWLGRRR